MEATVKTTARKARRTTARKLKPKRVPSAIPGYRNVELVEDPFGLRR